MGKTNKEIQADYKKRMRDNGYTQMAVWIHQEDKQKLRDFIGSLLDKRNEDS